MSNASAPYIDYQVISIAGKPPMVLLGLEVLPPKTLEVVLAIDLSDSCSDLSKLISYTQKLLGQLPSDWPLQIFRLSSPVAISRPNLRLQDFCESTHWQKELCVGLDSQRSLARTGSFLRPITEALSAAQNTSEKLLIILTDGQLGDFGQIDLPSDVDVIGLMPLSARENRLTKALINEQVQILCMQDIQVDQRINQYTHPFFGPVIVEPDSKSACHDRLHRVDAEGRLTSWAHRPNQIFNLALGRHYVLFDGSIEEAQMIRWELKSCSNESVHVSQCRELAICIDPILVNKIVANLAQSTSRIANEIICWLKHDHPEFSSIRGQFQIALGLVDEGKAWIDDNGKMLVFTEISGASLFTDDGKSKHHGLVAISVTSSENSTPSQIGLFALNRDHNPAFAFQPGELCGGLLTTDNSGIYFDQRRNRWMLARNTLPDSAGQILNELEYYAAERLDIPITHPDGAVTVLFSGNLRR